MLDLTREIGSLETSNLGKEWREDWNTELLRSEFVPSTLGGTEEWTCSTRCFDCNYGSKRTKGERGVTRILI